MTDELFNNEQVAPTDNPIVSMHEELVGEGKKYSDNEKLALSVDHKERFIQQLQTENEGLRGELATRVSLQEFMENQETRNNVAPTTLSQDQVLLETSTVLEEQRREEATTNQQGTKDVTNLVETETARILEQKLTERDAQTLERNNISYVTTEATRVLGSEYPYLFSKKAKEMDVSQDYLNEMARKQPKAFLGLMLGQDYKVASSGTPPSSSVNTTALQALSDNSSGHRKLSDWDELRKTDPNKYWSSSVQQEIFKEAFESDKRGEAFVE